MKEAKHGFLSAYLKDHGVAAIQPSSPFLVRRLLRKLAPAGLKMVVELGSGPGVATRPLLAELPTDCRYVAIERNPSFATELRLINDPRLDVVEGDARQVRAILNERGIGQVDAVISSIPCTYLSHQERHALLGAVEDILSPHGVFIVFHQYSPLMRPYLRKHFRRVRTEFEPLNVFPCFLFRCEK